MADPVIPTEALEAAARALNNWHAARDTWDRLNEEQAEHWYSMAWAALVDAAPHLIAVGRQQAAADVEGPGSQLCDCDDADSPPTNPRTGVLMDHHCDCAAVHAAATMLGGRYSATKHARECVHGTQMDRVAEGGTDA